MFNAHRGFLVMWFLVVLISAHDSLLVLVNRATMIDNELNPVGRWLILLNGDDVWLLLVVKTIGTVCVSAMLLLLYWFRPRLGWIVCAAVATFQTILLMFLYLT